MDGLILAVNCGSSSLKFGVYRAGTPDPELVCEGEAEEIGKAGLGFRDHASALRRTLDDLRKKRIDDIRFVGHRVVHGGPNVREHCRLTKQVAEELRNSVPFAPLHLPAALAAIETITEQLPNAVQVVCLDTAFHFTMPDVAKTLALPKAVRDLGVARYGFHGLSLESILRRLEKPVRRLIVAHLGNGASVTAVLDGRSADTTMGLTPTGGILMGTRTGDLDPGVMIYLLRHGYTSAEDLEQLVDHESGLKGISGIGSDVRELIAANSDPNAALALQMFCYQTRKAIAAMASVLGGLDLLVFSGGIGEHADALREEILGGLSFLTPFEARVMESEEDLQIARIAQKISAGEGGDGSPAEL